MKITERKITVHDITEGYHNDLEEGVTGFNGNLDIRPQYQREFVYDEKKRNEVIRTVMKGFPLNVMYWVDRGDNTPEDIPRYEVMDGQQRTISICEYIDGNFSVDDMFFFNLPANIKQQILDYELFIYVCEGSDSEKLDWFQIINIAGEQLTNQEIRNAIYAGPWVSDAKRYFSKTGCPASKLGSDYLRGSSIRQEYLETAIDWLAQKNNKSISAYMSEHQQDKNAIVLWNYFTSVINWVEATFPVKRSIMKGVPWGILFNNYGQRTDLDPAFLEKEIQKLLEDDDVTRQAGVYEYLLTGDVRKLSIRLFDKRTARSTYEKQNHKCAICGGVFEFEKMHADHIVPWSAGGHTIPENCQMLCRDCNLKKGAQ